MPYEPNDATGRQDMKAKSFLRMALVLMAAFMLANAAALAKRVASAKDEG
jgi:hypothetical protein